MFNISKSDLSEILYILDDDEVFSKMDIRFYKEYMALVSEVEVDRTNGYYFENLAKAANDIREWLDRSNPENKYSIKEEREETINGYIHTIEIRENHYY
jgi:hypothetical protein